MMWNGRREPDEAAFPADPQPGVLRILAAIILGCLLYLVIAVGVAAAGLGTVGLVGALVAATWVACRTTGLRGRKTYLLIGLVVFFGTAAVSSIALAFLGSGPG